MASATRTDWVWHPEMKNYYRQEYDGASWHTIWAPQNPNASHGGDRRDSLAPSIPSDLQGLGVGTLGETIRGEQEVIDSETLDPGYMIQQRRFFTTGRMFSVLFTEPCGENAASGKNDDKISHVKFGERVYSNIRRFIVVKEGRGFAYACPVSTYGGRATTKRGLDPQQHAIVYIGGTYAQHVQGEQRLHKTPIPICPTDQSLSLSPASRINFAIHHPIQHNVKVKDLGVVQEDYIPLLISYARSESGW